MVKISRRRFEAFSHILFWHDYSMVTWINDLFLHSDFLVQIASIIRVRVDSRLFDAVEIHKLVDSEVTSQDGAGVALVSSQIGAGSQVRAKC